MEYTQQVNAITIIVLKRPEHGTGTPHREFTEMAIWARKHSDFRTSHIKLQPMCDIVLSRSHIVNDREGERR